MGEEVRRLHVGIVGDDPGAPGGQQLRHAGANPAEADEPDGLSRKAVRRPATDVIGEVLLFAPFAGADVGVALAQLLEQRQHEGDGGLCHAEAVGLGRGVAHHDAEVRRRLGVDVIDADRIFRHHPQALRGLHDPPGDRGVADRGAHQSDHVAGGFHDLVFHIAGARELPLILAEHDFAAQVFQRLDGLRRLFATGENQNLGL